MYRQNYPDQPGMHNQPSSSGRGMQPRSAEGWARVAQHEYRAPPTFVQAVKQAWLTSAIGLGLVCVAIGVLFWNEGRAVLLYKSLDEGLGRVVSVESADLIDPSLNHQLIHISAPLSVTQPVVDPDYQLSVNAVKLKRTVEMYQWIETETKNKKADGKTDTSYSYHEEWKSYLIDSDSFYLRSSKQNPKRFTVSPSVETARDVKVGNYYLSENLIEKITNFKTYKITPDLLKQTDRVHIYLGSLYHGLEPTRPAVGDVRVKFEYAGRCGDPSTADVVSVIGKQDGQTVRQYQTNHGDIELLYVGHYSAQVMFGHERASNALLTWALRFVGWLLLFVGLGCWTYIISTLAESVPLVGELLGLGIHVMNTLVALSLSLLVISLGWVWHRPLVSAFVLFCACLPFLYAKFRGPVSPIAAQRRSW